MNALEMMDVLNAIEMELPVDQWTIGGVHVWPLVRIQLGMDLFCDRHAVSLRTSTSQTMNALTGLVAREIRFMKASWMDRSHNESSFHRAEALFLSDGVSFVNLAGKQYERFCDPLRDHLKDMGMKSVMLIPGDAFYVPRHSVSKFIQPDIDWIQVRSKLLRPERSLNQHLPGFENLSKFVGSHILDENSTVSKIRKHVALIREYACYFEKILDEVRPSACFLASFYWLIGYGLLLACRRKGIPSIDIQHGLQGHMHQSYGRWLRIPTGGYELLPSWYWCWDESDVRSIEEWSKTMANVVHRAFLGGNLFLEIWREGTLEFVKVCDKLVKRRVPELAYQCHVLVTLQRGLLSRDLISLLRETIATTHAVYFWWIRMHPTMDAHDRSVAQEVFGFDQNVELTLASDLPLYALLRHVSVHVTHCSSVVLEAETLGIKSIVCSNFGLDLFPEQVKSGVVVYASSVPELTELIRQQSVDRIPLEKVAVGARQRIERSRYWLKQLVSSESELSTRAAIIQ